MYHCDQTGNSRMQVDTHIIRLQQQAVKVLTAFRCMGSVLLRKRNLSSRLTAGLGLLVFWPGPTSSFTTEHRAKMPSLVYIWFSLNSFMSPSIALMSPRICMRHLGWMRLWVWEHVGGPSFMTKGGSRSRLEACRQRMSAVVQPA